MAYQPKVSLRADVAVTLGGDDKNPREVEGFYLGTKKVPSDFGADGFTLLHIFQTSDGNVGVWGKTRLNELLTADLLGSMCLVQFTGMIPAAKKGRKPSYGYSLQFDPERTIDVSNIVADDAAAEDEGAEDEQDNAVDNAPTIFRSTAKPASSAASLSEKQSATHALLSNARAAKANRS